MRYGEDKNGFNFTENILNLSSHWRDFSALMEFEYSRPPELGVSYQGLRKFRFDYRRDNLLIGVGDIYEIWGWGTILSQIDDQSIDFDTGTRGLLLDFQHMNVQTKLLTGLATVRSSSDQISNFQDRVPNYRTNHTVLGLDESIRIRDFDLGLTYFQDNETHYTGFFMNDSLDITHRFHGVRLGYFNPNFDVYTEYFDKTSSIFDDVNQEDTLAHSGSGVYMNLNLYLSSWSLTAEYKRLDLLRQYPFGRGDVVNNYGGYSQFQNPPTIYKEHSSTLLTRITHQVDYNNERAFQIELTGPVLDQSIEMTLNYARASRNQSWDTSVDTSYTFLFPKYTPKAISPVLPDDDLSTNPFQETFGELRGYFLDHRLQVKIGYDYQWDVPDYYSYLGTVNDTVDGIVTEYLNTIEYVETQKAITVPIQFSYLFNGGWNLDIKMDKQSLKHGHETIETSELGKVKTFESLFEDKSGEKVSRQYSRYLSFTISKSPRVSFTLNVDASRGEKPPILTSNNQVLGDIMNPVFDGIINTMYKLKLEKYSADLYENRWISVECLYNLSRNVQVSVFYGSIRGGLVCSNGICRYVQPFNQGLILSVNSIF